MSKFKRMLMDKDTILVLKNIIWSLIIKGLAMIVSFYSLSAYLTYFGDSTYLGVWLTIVSIINWIMVFDLGIGNGLRNYITKSLANGERNDVSVYISSAYFSLGVVALIGLLICSCLSFIVNWNEILNISSEVVPIGLLRIIMSISFANIFIRFFLNLITSILYALQKTFIVNLIALLTNVFLLSYLIMANPTNDINAIYQLSYVHLFISNIPLVVASVIVFYTSLKFSKPTINSFNWNASKRVLSLGGLFFVAQIEMLLMNATNELMVINIFGAKSVVDYQVYFKVFSIASMIFAIIIQPVWSAITKCVSTKDFKRISNYSWLLYIVAIIGFIACIVVAFSFQKIVDQWLSEKSISVSLYGGLVFSFYIGSFMLMNASTCIANGFGMIKTQITYLGLALIIKFSVSYLFCRSWIDLILVTSILQLGMAIIQGVVNRQTISKLRSN